MMPDIYTVPSCRLVIPVKFIHKKVQPISFVYQSWKVVDTHHANVPRCHTTGTMLDFVPPHFVAGEILIGVEICFGFNEHSSWKKSSWVVLQYCEERLLEKIVTMKGFVEKFG